MQNIFDQAQMTVTRTRQSDIEESSGSEEESDESLTSSNDPALKEGYYPILLHIQMDYCSGDTLREYLEKNQRVYDPCDAYWIFIQILDGLIHIHDTGIIHRDLKPANIFFDKKNGETILKIGDFGLATSYKRDLRASRSQLDLTALSLRGGNPDYSANVGTPLYLAPEQEGGPDYDEKVDIFSLGLILMEICCIFGTTHERYEALRGIRFSHRVPLVLSEKFPTESELILYLTRLDKSQRPSAREILASDRLLRWKEEALMDESQTSEFALR